MSAKAFDVIGGVAMTKPTWKEIRKDVQQALDALDAEYEVGYSGLTCKAGTYRMETLWTDSDGYEYRLFDMGHGATGVAGTCYPLPYSPEGRSQAHIRNWRDNMVSHWSYVHRLPETEKLVKVDGWPICRRCGKPTRPMSARASWPAAIATEGECDE